MLSRYHRAIVAEQEAARARWNIDALLFLEQLNVARDKHPRRVVDGSRRCGKSFLAAVLLLDTAICVPRSRCLFLALTREDARDLVWQDILTLNETFALGGKPNHVRLEIVFPNRSRIRLGGAKDRQQAERWRGRFFDLVIIDECQMFPSHLRDLVESVLKPTLIGGDLSEALTGGPRSGRRGRIILMGTPGAVPGVGYWEERVSDPRWSMHHWILDANPWLGSPIEVTEFLADMAQSMGGEESPEYRREYRGERPEADDKLDRPFRYNATRNHFETSILHHETTKELRWTQWALPVKGFWKFFFGLDIGKRAASAIAVLGVCDEAPGYVWLVEEWIAVRQPLNVFYDKIQERRAIYHPQVMCIDEGALGVMIADEWRAPPYLLPVTAAEKTHEHVQAEFISAALSRGDFKVRKDSAMAADMAVCRWDPELLKKGKRKIALDPHSDIVPAGRYAFKDAYAVATTVRRPPRPLTEAQKETANLDEERQQAAERANRVARGLPAGYGARMLDAWKNR